ncbi:MAG: GNAT family N-acetyltransferase [Chlamydiales bacterium]|nr:GNAT family N-acetyltransferase [Chlamydiales bacterium]
MYFQHLQKTQVGMVKKWLAQDYVAKFWHGQGLQNTLEAIDRFVDGKEKLFTLWIAYKDEIPFAFLMTSNIDPKESHFCNYCEEEAISLDLLIGDQHFLGKGLAAPMIQKFVKQFDVRNVFIDPGVENKKAIHVYEKAGFKKLEEFIPEWDPSGRCVLMQLQKE